MYCSVNDLIPLNVDVSEAYNTLDLKIVSGKKLSPFTLIWTKDRLLVLEVSPKKKEIVGSFYVSFGGSSDTVIKSVV